MKVSASPLVPVAVVLACCIWVCASCKRSGEKDPLLPDTSAAGPNALAAAGAAAERGAAASGSDQPASSSEPSTSGSHTAIAPATNAGVAPAARQAPATNAAIAPSAGQAPATSTGVAPAARQASATNAAAAPSARQAPATMDVASDATALSARRTDPEGMLLVPGGEFTMGIDLGGEEDEHPAHRVRVVSFYLDKLEVTVEDYLHCVRAGKCRMYREDAAKSFRAGDDARFRSPKQPISGVSWDDAVAYCAFVGKRLPREAEWERAASGDDRRKFVWGNQAPDPTRFGCFMRAVGPKGQTTCEVGSFPEGAGPYGHLDLAGNVWEWTSDDYDPYAYHRSTAGAGIPGNCQQILLAQDEIRASGRHGFTGSNPVPTTCEKVLRGGAFNYPGPGLRVTNRVHHPGGWRMLVAGFRCALDAPANP